MREKERPKKVRFAAQGTQQAGEERGPDTELRSQNSKGRSPRPPRRARLGRSPRWRRAGWHGVDASPRCLAPSRFLKTGGEGLRDRTVQASDGGKKAGEGSHFLKVTSKARTAPGLGPRLPDPYTHDFLGWSLPSSEAGGVEEPLGSMEERLRLQEVTQGRGYAGNCSQLCPLKTVPLGHVALPEPLPGGTSEGSYLLQRVHHGLQVHALGKLLLPSARAKRDRWSVGGSDSTGAHPGAVPRLHNEGTAVTPPLPALQEFPVSGWWSRRASTARLTHDYNTRWW